MRRKGDNDQVAVQVGRNGWIWGVVLRVELEGVAVGVHRRSVGKRKVTKD